MAHSASAPYNSVDTSSDDSSNTLANTPTWAVGVVCIIIVIVSFFLELGLKKLDKVGATSEAICCSYSKTADNKYFERTQQKPLQDTLTRMKEDVMMLGFISLMLVITRDSLAKICVPDLLSDYMLPCGNGRVPASSGSTCSEGQTPLMSIESLHQLHMFIFVMAMVHVCYSCMTMILARLQISGWRNWEEEIRNLVLIDSLEVYRQSNFLVDRVHSHRWTSALGLSCIDSFFRQFWNPVKKSDYLNLRRGFVKSHNASPKFNFLNYMMRTMEDDFKTIVAIRAYLWMFVIIFMLLNIHGWYTYFWIAFLPFTLLLVVGTKLQHVITSLAVEIVNSDGEIGDSVKPRDELFWFSNPEFMLHLIHFILFQNSFELAYFIWIWGAWGILYVIRELGSTESTYGLDSCFMEKRGFVYARVALGFVSQTLCSYTTLPLYALVTQMGSSYKKAIFSPPLAKSLRDWHQNARKSKKKRTEEGTKDSLGGLGVKAIPSHVAVELLHQQDSLHLSHVLEAPKAPAPEYKGTGLLAQKCSSDLPIIKQESTSEDTPKTTAQEAGLRSSLNRAEVQIRMSASMDPFNVETSSDFVSVAIDPPVCAQESSRLDDSK